MPQYIKKILLGITFLGLTLIASAQFGDDTLTTSNIKINSSFNFRNQLFIGATAGDSIATKEYIDGLLAIDDNSVTLTGNTQYYIPFVKTTGQDTITTDTGFKYTTVANPPAGYIFSGNKTVNSTADYLGFNGSFKAMFGVFGNAPSAIHIGASSSTPALYNADLGLSGSANRVAISGGINAWNSSSNSAPFSFLHSSTSNPSYATFSITRRPVGAFITTLTLLDILEDTVTTSGSTAKYINVRNLSGSKFSVDRNFTTVGNTLAVTSNQTIGGNLVINGNITLVGTATGDFGAGGGAGEIDTIDTPTSNRTAYFGAPNRLGSTNTEYSNGTYKSTTGGSDTVWYILQSAATYPSLIFENSAAGTFLLGTNSSSGTMFNFNNTGAGKIMAGTVGSSGTGVHLVLSNSAANSTGILIESSNTVAGSTPLTIRKNNTTGDFLKLTDLSAVNKFTVNGIGWPFVNDTVAYQWVAYHGGTGGVIQDDDSLYIRPVNEGTVTGNSRGLNSVDLQVSRIAATQVASGTSSTILGGLRNTASGSYSLAGGHSAQANGAYSVAIGYSNISSNSYSLSLGGTNNTSSGSRSTSIGGTTNLASGNNSIAMGFYNTAHDYGEISLGFFSTVSTGSASVITPSNIIFKVGNGLSTLDKRDAFHIRYDGLATFTNAVNTEDSIGINGSYIDSWADVMNNYGGVTVSGTPVVSQGVLWTDANTIKGDDQFVYHSGTDSYIIYGGLRFQDTRYTLPDTGWLAIDNGGNTFASLVTNAAHGLIMPLPNIFYLLKDQKDGEIAWYYSPDKGKTVEKTYGLKGDPGAAIQQLQAAIEIQYRHTRLLYIIISILSLVLVVFGFKIYKK